jgi:hypothetical protein
MVRKERIKGRKVRNSSSLRTVNGYGLFSGYFEAVLRPHCRHMSTAISIFRTNVQINRAIYVFSFHT